MRKPISRRSFLSATTAAVAAGSIARPAFAGAESVDVAIVGAGLAGLNAAMILTELGAKVVVLEADSRAGGRVLTKDQWPLQPDLGGVQIGTDYARVLDVANRLGVKLGPGSHINAPYSFVLGDQLVPAGKWSASPLNRLVGAEREVPPHALGGFYVERRTPFQSMDDWLGEKAVAVDISLGEWLTRQGASDEARRIIQSSQGVPLERTSVLRMFQEATRGRISMAQVDEASMRGKDAYERAALLSRHVVGGTSRLVEAIVASLGDRVRFGRCVTTIDQDASGCSIRCADGTRVRARFALAAVPFSVLREVRITPSLQGAQADAVAHMPYGNQSQVWLRVKRPYWEADGIEASMWTDGPFNLIRQQIESDGARELVSALAFTANALKLDALPPAERGRFAIAYMERIRPSLRGALEFVGAHSWQLAPFSRGCSHQYVPGRVVAWSHAMATPHQRLHFAGEHTRRLEVGMESAMESGERAATEILERLG
jgi:monoamine oxidase